MFKKLKRVKRVLALALICSGLFAAWDPGNYSGGIQHLLSNLVQSTDSSITYNMEIAKYSVTQELYTDVIGTNPSYFTSNPDSGEIQELRPVEQVNWYESVAFCNALSAETGLAPYYEINGTTITILGGNGWRLPTSAEWQGFAGEWAAAGGYDPTYDTYGPYAGLPAGYANTDYNNETILNTIGWYSGNSNSKTHEVGLKSASALGLYDLAGNVFEWCYDSSGSNRVLRGGLYYGSAAYYGFRVGFAGRSAPAGRSDGVGFRVVRTLPAGGSSGSSVSNIFNYIFNRASAADVSYRSQRNNKDVAKIQLSETMLALSELAESNFSDVKLETKDGGKPYINVPETNPVAQAINADVSNNMVVTASFYDLPKDKFPVIMMNGVQITDLNGNVFPDYTGYVKNIDWNNTTGTLTFEITHFTEYGVPALSGKTFSGTGAATAINAPGTNLAINVQNYSVGGTAALDTSRTVQKISGLAYETVLTDVTNNANYLYQAMVPGETYGISFEYINRGNASDTIDLSATLERQNTDNFNIESGANSVNYTDSKSIAAWQVASFNILINANDAYSLDVATLNVDVLVNGAATVSYNAFANAYAETFDSDRAYGGDNFNYVIILKAEGYDLQLLDRVISVNAPVGYTGEAISVNEIVPGTKIDYAIVIRNNSLSNAVSVNIKDVIPGNCHLYYVEGETPTVNGALLWEWKGATENVAPADDAIWYEITIPGQSIVTASYSVTLD